MKSRHEGYFTTQTQSLMFCTSLDISGDPLILPKTQTSSSVKSCKIKTEIWEIFFSSSFPCFHRAKVKVTSLVHLCLNQSAVCSVMCGTHKTGQGPSSQWVVNIWYPLFITVFMIYSPPKGLIIFKSIRWPHVGQNVLFVQQVLQTFLNIVNFSSLGSKSSLINKYRFY